MYNYWVWRLINWVVFELAPSYFKLPITKDGEQIVDFIFKKTVAVSD